MVPLGTPVSSNRKVDRMGEMMRPTVNGSRYRGVPALVAKLNKKHFLTKKVFLRHVIKQKRKLASTSLNARNISLCVFIFYSSYLK